LHEIGIDAEASRQATRGAVYNYDAIWQTKARAAGRLQRDFARTKASAGSLASRASAVEAWSRLRTALESSPDAVDARLAMGIAEMLVRIPTVQARDLGMSRHDPTAPKNVRDR